MWPGLKVEYILGHSCSDKCQYDQDHPDHCHCLLISGTSVLSMLLPLNNAMRIKENDLLSFFCSMSHHPDDKWRSPLHESSCTCLCLYKSNLFWITQKFNWCNKRHRFYLLLFRDGYIVCNASLCVKKKCRWNPWIFSQKSALIFWVYCFHIWINSFWNLLHYVLISLIKVGRGYERNDFHPLHNCFCTWNKNIVSKWGAYNEPYTGQTEWWKILCLR